MADNGFDLRDLPPNAFDYGFQEGAIRVRASLNLEAVEIAFRDDGLGEFQIVLGPTAAIELMLRVRDALAKLEARKDRGGE